MTPRTATTDRTRRLTATPCSDTVRGSGLVPGLALLRPRRGSALRDDVVAGVVLAALLVPQGLAYAVLAGLPPVTGLYATLIPLVVYFLLGPSRILVLGPDSAVSPLVAAAIIPLAVAGDDSTRIALAGMLALLVGVIMFAGGLARFGFVTELLSLPVRLGYLMGIAVTVIVAQLPKLFGFSVEAHSLIGGISDFVAHLDETSLTALGIGLASLVLILALRRATPKVPGVFLAVVGATVVTAVLGLQVAVVGEVPVGLPAFGVPDVSFDQFKTLVPAAVGVAFVAFADTSVLSRSYAARLHEEVDQNRELAVLGVANVATGIFQGFPISTSSSRTAVAEDVGARSQITGLVGAGILALLLIFGTGLVHDLPQATLAAIVIVAVLGLIDVGAVRRLHTWRPSEFILAMVAFTGVAALGVLWGVGIAIGVSLLAFIRRAWRPHDAVLGRVENLKGYHDLERYPDARRIPGLVLYRFDAPLFFANADYFRDRVRSLPRDGDVRWIVLAAEPITDIDASAGEILRDLDDELGAAGIELAFAELKDPVRDRLRRYGIEAAIGVDRFFPTLGVAVATYLRETGVDWLDWEDRAT
jgi:high affinity sulfate transporter 1